MGRHQKGDGYRRTGENRRMKDRKVIEREGEWRKLNKKIERKRKRLSQKVSE